ncbi:hypothetical protein F0562_011907 [Nyssa sinensis]|uniref:Uncharacterized protein n=1 Tax=Nyssa sinensis TaxID=561372 RepID=A0A5J4ZTV5_9ASTE|nr:hypothetical protein F0562_011907 [Nyssa sinensis]
MMRRGRGRGRGRARRRRNTGDSDQQDDEQNGFLALLGVSYGIVSSSWDPMREGSQLGWKEAQKNWPVFWQSLRGNSGKK